MSDHAITEDWLRDCGFKWEQHERQPHKHWLLWIGGACVESHKGWRRDHDSLGIELSADDRGWMCWLRSDIAGRYSRLLYIRTVYRQSDVEAIVQALTGCPVNWRNSLYGALRSPEDAARLYEERMRLDQRINLGWVDRVDQEKGIKGIDKDKRGAQLP